MPKNFASEYSLREKILHVLSIMHKGSANEVAAEVVELQGIASEEGVESITVEIEAEMEMMAEEGIIAEVKEYRQKKRYSLPDNAEL